MSGFNGKWVVSGSTKEEEFYIAIKSSQEFINEQRRMNEEFQKYPNPDERVYYEFFRYNKEKNTGYRACYILGQLTREIEGPFGVEQDTTVRDGRPCRGKLELLSDNKMVRYIRGIDFTHITIMEVIGDELIVTMLTPNGGGVCSIQTYRRVKE